MSEVLDDSLYLEITSAINYYMRKNQITVVDLARRLGVTPDRVIKILRVDRNLTTDTLERIADALGARFEITMVAKEVRR